MEKNKCIFLDRDGTINKEVDYLCRAGDIEILDGAAEGIRKFNQEGFLVIIVSNQSGIARGYFTMETAQEINAVIIESLLRKGARIDDVYICPHHKEGVVQKYAVDCTCRKPLPGMLWRARDYYHIDMEQSYVIGDKESDMRTAEMAGCRGILVLTGYGKQEIKKMAGSPFYVAENLNDAAKRITGR